MFTLYDGTTSVCAIKVRIVLAEKSLVWESRTLDLRKGDQFDPGYLKINPGAVVPTLIHKSLNRDKIIRESSEIMLYLENIVPDPTLMPITSGSKSKMIHWMNRIDNPLHPATGVLTHATAFRPSFLSKSLDEQEKHLKKIPDLGRRGRQRSVYTDGLDSPIVAEAIRCFEAFFSEMDQSLSRHEWLSGPTYSLADAAATPYVNRIRDLRLFQLWGEKYPSVSSWLRRIESRSSFKVAITDYFSDKDRAQFEAIGTDIVGQAQRILET